MRKKSKTKTLKIANLPSKHVKLNGLSSKTPILPPGDVDLSHKMAIIITTPSRKKTTQKKSLGLEKMH